MKKLHEFSNLTRLPKKILRIMKLTCFFMVAFMFSAHAESYAQLTKLDVNVENGTFIDVLKQIEKQSDFYFYYNNDAVDALSDVTISVEKKNVKEVLDQLLSGTDLEYRIIDKYIVVRKKGGEDNKFQILQNQIISGQILDAYGVPVPGVTVMIENTTNGTISDTNGHYTLSNVTSGDVIVFSFIGMKTEKVIFEGQTVVNVTMKEETIGLDEVVAVGYGRMKKSDITGSIDQIKADELSASATSNPVQAIQGRASGVAVMTSNAPGASPTIRIRGTGSISAGNDPLYVVDGFPLVDSELNDINSSDIESIEILKDASSTAIYGSRGANGVVLITTKSGIEGKNDLSVSSYYGLQKPARLVDLIDGGDFVNFINEGYKYATGYPVYTDDNPASSYNTDWQDEIMRNWSSVQEHSVNFSGGKNSLMYMLSGSIYSQDGLVASSGFKKYTGRVNLSNDFKKWFTVGTHLQFSHSLRDEREDPTSDLFRYGWPTTPVKNEDGSWYYASDDPLLSSYFEGKWNPVSDAHEKTFQTAKGRVLGDVYANLTLHKNLTFKINFGLDMANSKYYEYSTSESVAGLNTGHTGVGGQTYKKAITKLSESILTYSNIWNNVHRFTATGVYSYQDYTYEDLGLNGSGFTNDATGANDMSLADPESVTYSSDKYSNKLISFTSRLFYTYNDKYSLIATGRYDGSSRFGKNNKWGFFPSAGLSWMVNQEPFMNSLSGIISSLKLRSSYGITGNQEIGNYQSLSKLESAYYIFNDTPLLGFTESIGNPDLKWERTAQVNVGMDLSLWNRIDLTADYYSRRTTNLLYDVPIPTTSGYQSMLVNVGEVKNNGFEINVKARVFDKGNFKWELGANLSKNKNEVVELYGDVKEINIGSSSNGLAKYLKVGDPVTGIWARESAGIITTEEQLAEYSKIRSTAQMGEEMYVDQNEDYSINADDYVCIGSTVPNLFYGFTTGVSYKNWKLDVYGQGALDYASQAGIDNNKFGKEAIGYSSSTSSYLLYGENQILNNVYIPSRYAFDRMWSESNPNGTFPRAGAQGVYLSDRTNGGWNYFVLKNVVLSYNFRDILQNVNWTKDLKVYLNIQNFASYANQRGYNPENGDVSYPWATTFILGLNAKF
jgi:TonB-linked SusC/RagA family outer membrane protein